MAKTMSEAILDTKSAIANKLLQDDGTITDITGKEVVSDDEGYNAKPALPNKFLNADGTYSTLNEIFASVVDNEIFIIVDELPATGNPQKIYLVSDGEGGFIEYHFKDDHWDVIGVIEIDLSNYPTLQDMANAIEAAALATLNSSKAYTDEQLKNFVPLQMFPDSFVTDSTTTAFFNSVKAINPTVGSYYLGTVYLTDMPTGLEQAEVQIAVYPNKVLYATMRSADLSPYVWEANSYDYRGWEAGGTETLESAKAYTDAKSVTTLSSANTYTDEKIAEVDIVYEWDGQRSIDNPDNLTLWSEILEKASTQTVLVKASVYMFSIHQNQNEPMTMTYYSMANKADNMSDTLGFEVASVNITTSDSNFTVSNVSGIMVSSNTSLPMYGDGVDYTPTEEGHPATKKYVDDSIANNITNVLGGEY